MRARVRQLREAGDAGFGLIEVVMSAAILLLVSVGTLKLIDGAQGTARENRSRSIAAALAEQYQEKARATRVADLSENAKIAPIVDTVDQAGVTYRVVTTARWLRDASSAQVTCLGGTAQAEYIQLTTTVTDDSGARGVDPVTITSLVTPNVGTLDTTTGTLAVEIDDRAGNGLAGIPVTATGPETGTAVTNAAGCAIFDHFKVGSYTVTFSQDGYVTPLGQQDVSLGATVAAGTVATTPAQLYDRASSITVTAWTRKSAGGPLEVVDIARPTTSANAVTVANSGISNSAGGRLFFTPSSSWAGATATNLFPFASGDTVYAGSCATMEPSTAGAASNFYTTDPGRRALVALTPGAASTGVVYQPWLQVNVTGGGSAPGVYAEEACPGGSGPSASSTGNMYRLPSAATSGAALPFGSYLVCATNGTRQRVSSPVALNSTADKATVSLTITSTSAYGTCSSF